ncbi:SPOSA6832_00449 [Sporobolomyces salmonicolor]|uniref:SPOSA6832_00449-mRNA-1:cds n=1 Tax=Sporidiobolus salmonicolor TaxID=5005 RepID=A0A0D6EGP1_SPOSA|nr:SPOSA6832_00449 [Sporobolomyces salmonicolor]
MATSSTASPSALRPSTLYTIPQPSSPSSLRAPAAPSAPRSPNFARRDMAQPSAGESSARPSSTILQHVKGAEGGVEAITTRRRNSGSFKHMSVGSLVSNSPFTQRLGSVAKPPGSPEKKAEGLYGSSRIPTAMGSPRKTSGSRKASGETSGPVKENSNPSELNELGDGGLASKGDVFDSSLPRSRSSSPSVPFRPIRSHNPSPALSSTSAHSANAGLALGASSPFKPSRPTFGSAKRQPSREDLNQPRRQPRPSHAALQKNGLVSSSPFTNQRPPPPLPASSSSGPSPPLQQAPYEIGPLAQESAPFGYHDVPNEQHVSNLPSATSSPGKSTGQVGLGARPGGPVGANDRRIVAGASVPPSSTPPPKDRRSSFDSPTSPSSSSMAQIRRGMRGPRPMGADGEIDDGDETEREDASRPLRRQPSNKTVTWAETEEVLEFEVEEERRRSMMSDASTVSDDSRYYRHNSSDEYDDDEYDEGNNSYGFAEGGSIEVHDVDESDAEDSVVSAASSAMDDMIEQIDDFIHEGSYDEPDVFTRSQIPSFSTSQQRSHYPTPGYSAVSPAPPASAFSASSASVGDDDENDALSTSSYDDEEEDAMQATRQQLLERAARTSLQGAPGSPSRPPLPLPPSSAAPLKAPTPAVAAPAVAAPSHLAAPAFSTGHSSEMKTSDSAYSLPDIPGTSPFLGFGDDGTAGSVVTLDKGNRPEAIPSTRPLQPHHAAPSTPPSQSTPTAVSPATASPAPRRMNDSPILSAFNRLSITSPPVTAPSGADLSRQASLIGSDVTTSSISWYGTTANGSLRGGTLRLNRDRLEERKKAHQALLSGSPTGFGAFPTLSPDPSQQQQPSSVGPFSQAMEETQSAPASSAHLSGSRAIEARPAPKARSATLSSSMLPTIAASPQRSKLGLSVGAPLTADVAEEMASPLERLQRGMEGRSEGGEWRSGDSLLGVSELAKGGDEDALARRESGTELKAADIIAKRRAQGARPTRRRSASTGDANIAETASAPMEAMHTMPELGFEKRAGDAAFASGVLESLDDIYNSRNRTYRVRESRLVVAAASDINGSRAGDVDPGRAWRKKRPSDVYGITRSVSTVSVASRRARELSGQLFVHLKEVYFEGLPMPRGRVSVKASLDNGRRQVEAAERELAPKVALKKEFELGCSETLTFSIHFSVDNKPPPPPVVAAAPPPPPSPSKPSRGFRIFSSAKKKPATPTKAYAPPPPTPDPFYDFVSADGKIATATITFLNEAKKCRLKKARIVVPFAKKNPASPRACSGSLVLDLLFVPSVPGIPKTILPKSMDEVVDGLERADWAAKVTHESVLTQLGGDCPVWRRRIVKLRGNTLVPYSEVTKRSHVEINLAHVTSLEDLNVPTTATPRSHASVYDPDEDISRMDNSFRLHFKGGNWIDFFADNAESKEKWLDVLRLIVGTEAKEGAPEWAIVVRKLPIPKQP